jgi:hypothetical protein
MDKGIIILQKHISKIEKSNNKILDRAINDVLKLKNAKLSDISYKKIATYEILVHKDTNNFPVAKQKLLSKLSDLQTMYPFLTLCFDPSPELQPRKSTVYINSPAVTAASLPPSLNVNSPLSVSRKCRAQNENRLILTVNWEDYMRTSMTVAGAKDPSLLTQPMHLPRLGVEETMNEIKRKNQYTIQNAIHNILAEAPKRTLDEKTESRIYLEKNTMAHEITRTHFTSLVQQITRQYNGMIELFCNDASSVTVRVHWNVYLSNLALAEQTHRSIGLVPMNGVSIRPPSHTNSNTNMVNQMKPQHEEHIFSPTYLMNSGNPQSRTSQLEQQSSDSSESDYTKDYKKALLKQSRKKKAHKSAKRLRRRKVVPPQTTGVIATNPSDISKRRNIEPVTNVNKGEIDDTSSAESEISDSVAESQKASLLSLPTAYPPLSSSRPIEQSTVPTPYLATPSTQTSVVGSHVDSRVYYPTLDSARYMAAAPSVPQEVPGAANQPLEETSRAVPGAFNQQLGNYNPWQSLVMAPRPPQSVPSLSSVPYQGTLVASSPL